MSKINTIGINDCKSYLKKTLTLLIYKQHFYIKIFSQQEYSSRILAYSKCSKFWSDIEIIDLYGVFIGVSLWSQGALLDFWIL